MSSSFRLKGGQTCQITAEQITVGEMSWRIADLTMAQLTADPAILPGAWPLPAIAIRGTDGLPTVLVPEQPTDAWAAIAALHAARPDLAPAQPPPGAGAHSHASAPRSPDVPLSSSDTILAGFAHLSVFFAPVVMPLIIWLATRSSSAFTARHAKQALAFHLILAALQVTFVVLILTVVLGSGSFFASSGSGFPDETTIARWLIGGYAALMMFVSTFSLIQIIFSIIGGVKAFQGERYSYPLLGGL